MIVFVQRHGIVPPGSGELPLRNGASFSVNGLDDLSVVRHVDKNSCPLLLELERLGVSPRGLEVHVDVRVSRWVNHSDGTVVSDKNPLGNLIPTNVVGVLAY